MKRPTVLDAPLRLANRDPLADALEIFPRNPASGVLGLRTQPLGDLVVDVGGETMFFVAPFLQEPFRRLGAFFLQPLTELGLTLPEAVDLPAPIRLAIRVGGEISDAQVRAQPIVRRERRRFGHLHDHREVKLAVAIGQVGLTPDAVQPGAVVAVQHDRDDLPPRQGQDRHAIQPFPGQHPLVVDDGSVGAECGLNPLVALVGFRDLTDGPHRQLGREAEVPADVRVHQLLKPDLVGRPRAKGDDRNGIAGGVEASIVANKATD